jgi:hypothetical protein
MDQSGLIKAYGGILPSRGELRRAALFGVTEEERQTANQLLRLLPKPDPNKPVEWRDSPWNPVNIPTLEEMKLSPTGRSTLALFADTPKESKTKSAEPQATVAPEPAAGEQPAPPEPEPVNEYMAKLNWPPVQQQPAKDPVDDKTVPHKWQAAKPSSPSRDQQPLPPDGDYSSNQPLY